MYGARISVVREWERTGQKSPFDQFMSVFSDKFSHDNQYYFSFGM